MSVDQGSAGAVGYYGKHGNRIVGFGPRVEAGEVFGKHFDDRQLRPEAETEREYLARFADPGTNRPFRVADVVRYSVRAQSADDYETFNDTVLDLLFNRLRLRQDVADIVYIAAAEMIGPADPLAPQDPPWSAADRFLTVLLPDNEPLVVMGQRAAGYTVYYPAAVYLAGVPAQDLSDDAVPMTATLVHEYTHLVLGRLYGNSSMPWPESADFAPGRTAALVGAFAGAVEAGRQALRRDLAAVSDPGLRAILKHVTTSLTGMPKVDWDREAIPYLVEAKVAAACYDEPDAVPAVFGPDLPAAFDQHIAPALADAARTIVDTNLIAW